MRRVLTVAVLWALTSTPTRTATAEALTQTRVDADSNQEDASDVTLPKGTSPHYFPALLSTALTLVGGTTWYLIDDRNVLDWDKPSLKSRLTGSSWRYDSNGFWMNYNGHPLFGAGVYAATRDAHFGVPYAFVNAFATSMAWEFVIEYNERVSINDVIVTPLSGVAVGEFAHKLGYYLNSATSPSTGRSALGWTLTPVHRLVTLGCSDEPREAHPRDSLGYASGLWHDFSLAQSLSFQRADGHDEIAVYALRSYGKLVGLRGYRSRGERSHGFWNADVSRLSLDIEASREGEGIDLVTDSILMGYQSKSLSDSGGHEYLVGAAIGYRYQSSFARGQDDRRSWVGIPGFATELYWERPSLSSEIQLRAYPIFAGVSSPAFGPYSATRPEETYKKVLAQKGYFYAWGIASELMSHQRVGMMHSELSLRVDAVKSQEGLDRAQEELTEDTKTQDVMASLEWKGWVALPHHLTLGVTANAQSRRSRAESTEQTLSQRGLGFWLGTRF